ncbi:MAG: hypothetical protein ACQETF_11290 [Bacteroidota bacterium]
MKSFKPVMLFSAAILSLPIIAIIWGLAIYMVTGMTGRPIHPYFHTVTCFLLFILIAGWALYGSLKTSETVYRLCKFGAILSLLLPVFTAITSLVWTLGITDRPAGFLSGYSALEIPVYAAGIAMILILLFLTGSFLAARNIDGISF